MLVTCTLSGERRVKAIKVGHACLAVHKSRMWGGMEVFVQAEVNETYGHRKRGKLTHCALIVSLLMPPMGLSEVCPL